jgi:uncharacterized membrane protein YhhN
MEIPLLSLAVLISAVLAILFRQQENTKMYAVFKPLTTVLIIIIGLVIYNKTASDYSVLIIVALLFSLIGDVFLLSKKYFLQGLASFLIAHICFIIVFTHLYGFDWNPVILIPLIVFEGVFFSFLRKDLKRYSIPVLVYMTVIVVMNWQAINLYLNSGRAAFLAIAMGSILFSFSDSILAYNKFKKPFKTAGILILSSYWISIFTFTIVGLYIV